MRRAPKYDFEPGNRFVRIIEAAARVRELRQQQRIIREDRRARDWQQKAARLRVVG